MQRLRRFGSFPVNFVTAIFLTAVFLADAESVFAQMGMKPQPPRVATDTVVERIPVVRRKYNGQIEPIEKVVSLARVSGFLNRMGFKEGTMVQKGDILFELEDVRYNATVQSAKSRIEVIKAKITYAENTHKRNLELVSQKAVTPDTVENSLSLLQGLQAELLGAEADLLLAETDLSYTKIYAMISGRIGRTGYTEGNYITPSSGPLVTVVQIDPIYIRFSMSERDFATLFGNAGTLKQSAKVTVKLANDETYPLDGEIAIVNNEIQSTTDTLTVWAKFANPDQRLNPGGIVTVNLARGEPTSRPAIKVSAVMFDQKGHFVYTLAEKEFEDKDMRGNVTGTHQGITIERRDITLGPADGEYQTVFSGLTVGETLVTDGMHKASPGLEVQPVATEPAPEISTESVPLSPTTSGVSPSAEKQPPSVGTLTPSTTPPGNRPSNTTAQ